MVMRALALLLVTAVAATLGSQTVQGWKLPSKWVRGQDYVVVQSGGDVSAYGGYIFPGPAANASFGSLKYASPDGYKCEAQHYDQNYGIFETQDCANKWTKLITQGDAAGVSMSGCATVANRPCGCQGLCRPVQCTVEQIQASNMGDTVNGCPYHTQCRRQEELGLVTSCAHAHTFHFSLWFGITFAVVVAFAGFAMANMPLDMDSLLYTVGDPDDKQHQS